MPDNRTVTLENIRLSPFNFHVGMLIFTPILNKLSEAGLGYIRMWLVSVLLGCQNIEQNKKINYTSLNKLIGVIPKTLRTQRSLLKEAATNHNTGQVLRFNADLVGANKQSDFYYDPHTKHYTGQLKTLSTWCPSVRLADKGINMDYIHTTSGQPVYFNTSDNFYDLRERFKPNIDGFRLWCGFDQEQVLTFVVDRGIYSLDVFTDIVNSSNLHIVTWQKGYENDKWDDNAGHGKGSIIRDKNKKGDQSFRFGEQSLGVSKTVFFYSGLGVKVKMIRFYSPEVFTLRGHFQSVTYFDRNEGFVKEEIHDNKNKLIQLIQ